VQVDVGHDRVIGVNNWGEIFYKNLHPEHQGREGNGEWEQINGHLKQVTTSQNHVSWGIDNQDTLWFRSEANCDSDEPHLQCPIRPNPTPFFWRHVPYTFEGEHVDMADLDVGRDGIVWGCTANGTPIARIDVHPDNMDGESWREFEESCSNIAVCTNGDVWAITPDNRVLYREGIVYTAVEHEPYGTSWSFQTPNDMVPAEVACGGNGAVWMTDTEGRLYRKTGTQDRARSEGELEPVLVDNGPWSYISVSEQGEVYGLKNGQACSRNECFNTDLEGPVKNFNAGNNEIWMVNVHNEVYSRKTDETAWTPRPGHQAFVTVAETEVVWAIDAVNEVWRWDDGDITLEEIVDNVQCGGWTHVEQRQLVKLDVGYNAQVVGIEEGTGNAVFRTGVTPENVMGDDWFVLGSGYTEATMCANGLMWATTGDSLEFRVGIVAMDTPEGTDFDQLVEDDNQYTSISCGYRARLWATTANGNVIRRTNINSYNWRGDDWSVVS